MDHGEAGAAPGAEGIRAWYKRTTRKAMRSLVFATVLSVLGMLSFWILVPQQFIMRLQAANGAFTIPVFGALWLASFIFIWLLPMRELSFRGQESFERMEERMKLAIQEKLVPAVEIWTRIGQRVEQVVLPKIESTLDEARTAVHEIRKTAKNVDGRIGPIYESTKRLEQAVEGKLGLLATEVTDASRAVQGFFAPQGDPPDVGQALSFLGTSRNGHARKRS